MNTIIGSNISEAVEWLSRGNVVGIPTETVYGLAGNALNPQTVLEIFKVKERPTFDPLIVHIPSISKVEIFTENIPDIAFKLMEEFWPGPLTLVLPKKKLIPDLVTSGLNTVAIRVPNHHTTLSLLNEIDFPLAAPSANPFGYISPTSAQHVFDQLGGKIPYILDGGKCNVGVESTIVGFEDNQCLIYRLGGLTLEDIRKVVPDVKLAINTSSNPKAPGMMKSHYAPSKPLYFGYVSSEIMKFSNNKIAALTFGSSTEMNVELIYNLSEDGNLNEAASNLFSYLRLLDESPLVDIIIAEPVPEVGLGRAINDRLKRAANT